MADRGTVPRALLDRYELRERAGQGGMGEVWLGWDRRLQRDVAVKLLLPELSREPSFRERFGVEARAAAALDHPNIVQVYDVDEDDGSLFIVMERLPGPSLDRRLATVPMSEEEVRRLADDLLSGLGAAHAANVVHRDIKPGNLIRSAGGRWKVGDFGVAKDLASAAHLTLVGVAVGTPAYLAPEQLDGRPATYATDLWAAAVVLRESLTGVRPFDGPDPVAVAHAVTNTVPPPLATIRPDLDLGLAAAVDRALSLDPRRRFASAREMLDAVEGRPVPPPPGHVPAAPPVAPRPPGSATPPGSGVPPAGAPAGPPAGSEVGAASGPGFPAPAVADRGSRSSTVRIVAVTAIVAGLLLTGFLVALLFGVVLRDRGSDQPEPVPETSLPSSAPSSTATGPGPSSEAPTTTEAPATTDPPTSTGSGESGEEFLPGAGPTSSSAPEGPDG